MGSYSELTKTYFVRKCSIECYELNVIQNVQTWKQIVALFFVFVVECSLNTNFAKYLLLNVNFSKTSSALWAGWLRTLKPWKILKIMIFQILPWKWTKFCKKSWKWSNGIKKPWISIIFFQNCSWKRYFILKFSTWGGLSPTLHRTLEFILKISLHCQISPSKPIL